MKYTCSFVRERVFLLLVILISVFLLGTHAFAQEENPTQEEAPYLIAQNSNITGLSVVSDSCVIYLTDGGQLPFGNISIEEGNEPISVACQVINTTEQDTYIRPSLQVETEEGVYSTETQESKETYLILHNETRTVLFPFPSTDTSNITEINILLGGGAGGDNTPIFSTNEPERSTNTESNGMQSTKTTNVIFIFVVTILALIILLAILIYMRKTREPVEYIKPPKEGTVN